jgi:hypothetical protein
MGDFNFLLVTVKKELKRLAELDIYLEKGFSILNR